MTRWFSLLALACAAYAQPGGLPAPAGSDEALKARGFREKFLPARAAALAPDEREERRGWILYHRDRNFEVLPNSRPAPGERAVTLDLTATTGAIESQPFSAFALRAVEGMAAALRVAADGRSRWLSSAAQVDDVLFHPVQYRDAASREKAYLRYPVFIRPPAPHAVPAGESRLYWVTVAVPESTAAGVYDGAIRVSDAAGNDATLPLRVRVLPFRLTSEGVPRFGAFLSGAPFAKGEFAFMKRYGMDALQWFWNSHAIRVLNDGGGVKLDFTEYDVFVRGMVEAGMRGPLVLSLGNSWLAHYEIKLAEAFGLRLMRRTLEGRTVTMADMTDPRFEPLYVEGLRLIFEHAKTAAWPPLALLIADEPTKHIMAYHPYRYQLVKKHFPDVPVYGVFFQPEKDPGPLLHSCDIVVANRDFDRMRTLASEFHKRFWTYNNVSADESFGKIRLLYGQIPAYYGSETMWFWCWNYYVGNAWDDFDGWSEERGGPPESDADWVAVYPSVDGVEPVRTLAVEAAREAIDDVRYLKTLEQAVAAMDPRRWNRLRDEIRRRQQAMFAGITLDRRTGSDADFFTTARNDDPERLRAFVIEQMLELGAAR